MILDLRTEPDKKALATPHFPTRMQAVIWRNWGLVPVERLALVLGASEEQIREAASDLGLEVSQTGNEAIWLERGYITIIRANWHLLPVEQLLELLGWTEDRLAFTLKEDDFLWIKLGSLKPWTESVKYRVLNESEQERTRLIRESTAALSDGRQAEKPFDFLNQYRKPAMRENVRVREPGHGEIRLDISWTIEAPSGHPVLDSALERFVTKLERNWGAKWTVRKASALSPNEEINPVMRIEIVPDSSQLTEDHLIVAGTDTLTIRAAAETGIMRGLQWLAGQACEGHAPYLMAGEYRRTTKFDMRIIYSYGAVYGDPLLTPELDPFPEALLERLSDAGVNGIWLQSVLYNLVPLAGLPEELSLNWEQRIAGLRFLADRAAKYGIGVYLYCNEPRSMPVSFFCRQTGLARTYGGRLCDAVHIASGSTAIAERRDCPPLPRSPGFGRPVYDHDVGKLDALLFAGSGGPDELSALQPTNAGRSRCGSERAYRRRRVSRKTRSANCMLDLGMVAQLGMG